MDNFVANPDWGSLLSYEPMTGLLTNKMTRSTRAQHGAIAGCTTKQGYIAVRQGGKGYKAHRVIWELVNGPIPAGAEIDHINGVKDDNRLINLRLVTSRGNKRNRSRQANNTSGVNGVCWSRRDKRYKAYITVDGVKKHLGYFKDIPSAKAAYDQAADFYGFHRNHGRA